MTISTTNNLQQTID